MADQVVERADLRALENSVRSVYGMVSSIQSDLQSVEVTVSHNREAIYEVQNEVTSLYSEVLSLSREVGSFFAAQRRQNRKNDANNKITHLKSDIAANYSHHELVRRNLQGILRTKDLGLVKKSTVENASEELLLQASEYWLAACLVALSAWISDKKELVEKAIAHAMDLDKEKTSLLFALVTRRFGRNDASLKWIASYLDVQDPEELDRTAIVIIDAYANGLLAPDAEGIIINYMMDWLEEQKANPDFIDMQRDMWINSLKAFSDNEHDEYSYLPQYISEWETIDQVLSESYLYDDFYNYLITTFSNKPNQKEINRQLENILDNLTHNYEAKEQKIRKALQFEELIIDCDGDELEARKQMESVDHIFDERCSFTQLLTDAVTQPENVNVSSTTQKLAIALSRDWIMDAYRSVRAEIRNSVPETIEIKIGGFKGTTQDGTNENELVNALIANENEFLEQEMKKASISQNDKIRYGAMFGGAFILGLFLQASKSMLFGLFGLLSIAAFIGCAVIAWNYYSLYKREKVNVEKVKQQYAKNVEQKTAILKACLAEVVDFREEFAINDQDSNQAIDYMDQLKPEHFVQKLAETTRRVRV